MTDNSAALRRARRRDGLAKRRQALAAIETMAEAGDPISFPSVARRAGVSISLLYADNDLVTRIAGARDRQRQAGAVRAARLPARSLITEASLHADLANAREQNRRLTGELAQLRDRLARDLATTSDIARGRAVSPVMDRLEERAADLETDNARLRQQVGQLEADTRELSENLEAARDMNRELMNAVNRRGQNQADTSSRHPEAGVPRVSDVDHTPDSP